MPPLNPPPQGPAAWAQFRPKMTAPSPGPGGTLASAHNVQQPVHEAQTTSTAMNATPISMPTTPNKSMVDVVPNKSLVLSSSHEIHKKRGKLLTANGEYRIEDAEIYVGRQFAGLDADEIRGLVKAYEQRNYVDMSLKSAGPNQLRFQCRTQGHLLNSGFGQEERKAECGAFIYIVRNSPTDAFEVRNMYAVHNHGPNSDSAQQTLRELQEIPPDIVRDCVRLLEEGKSIKEIYPLLLARCAELQLQVTFDKTLLKQAVTRALQQRLAQTEKAASS